MSHEKGVSLGNDPGSDDPRALRQFIGRIATVLNNMLKGRLNNVLDPSGDGSFVWTATANAASTVITDNSKQRWGYHSAVIFVPMTANADAVAIPYVTQANLLPGSMTVTHINNANNDKTYRIVVLG